MSTPPTRVVVTGCGAVTNLGADAASTWRAMREGRSGLSPIEGEEFSRFPDEKWTVKTAGQIKDWSPTGLLEPRDAKRLDRVAHFGIAAACEAVDHASIDFDALDRDRCGVVVGSGIGGIKTIEDGVRVLEFKGPDRLSPFTVPRLMINAVAGNVSIRFGLRGPASAHATACASSGHALGDALSVIRRGEADLMIAGGSEAAVTPLCVGAFMTMKALSQSTEPATASRPFDQRRDGFVLAEGAAMVVLESEAHAKARGAEILGELVGFGNSSDASHITAPDPEGRGAARAMRSALTDARLEPTQIDYVNAHGTSTPLGDRAEVSAVLEVFGSHARASAGGQLVMSSTKSMHGHCLGASGAVETLACLGAIRHGVIPPTINLNEPDDVCDLNLAPGVAVERPVRYAMNNTFGFGGHNVSLVFGRYDG